MSMNILPLGILAQFMKCNNNSNNNSSSNNSDNSEQIIKITASPTGDSAICDISKKEFIQKITGVNGAKTVIEFSKIQEGNGFLASGIYVLYPFGNENARVQDEIGMISAIFYSVPEIEVTAQNIFITTWEMVFLDEPMSSEGHGTYKLECRGIALNAEQIKSETIETYTITFKEDN